MDRFIGRKKELEFLEEKFSSKRGELVILYGHRRIGKTETLKEFAKGKKAVFYTCTQAEDKAQLRAFSSAISPFLGDKYFTSFQNWTQAFDSVKDFVSTGQEKRVLIIDEFPYAVAANREIPSILQKEWDRYLQSENVLIILCGSSMSFMEKEILGEKMPLYGRATGIYKMVEMPFFDAVSFLDGYSLHDKLTVYSICGGVPFYLKEFDTSKNIKDNIISVTLKKGSILYSEPEFLLRQELREPGRYNSIIMSIALGKTKFSEIQDDTALDKGVLSVYLKNLIELGLVERELPVTVLRGEKPNPQRGIYKIKNYFFRFWYAIVFPNITLLEFGDVAEVYAKLIEPNLDYFVSSAFEDVCIEYLKRENGKLKLPFMFTKIGRWWDKSNEIDIIAMDKAGNTISGECKYRTRKADISDLRKHISKDISSVYKGGKGKLYYYFFSFNGFEEEAVRFAEENGITLVSGDNFQELSSKIISPS